MGGMADERELDGGEGVSEVGRGRVGGWRRMGGWRMRDSWMVGR